MVLLGGAGTVFGPVVGAAVIVGLHDLLATSTFPITVVTGLFFMGCVLLFRRGLVGELAHVLREQSLADDPEWDG